MAKKKITSCAKRAIGVCCRYNFTLINNTTIKEVLTNNDWIFNNAWNFWAYCERVDAIKMSEFSVDPIVDDKYILFSSTIHDFDDWEDIIEWDDYGAWYAYNFPLQKPKIKEVLLLGKDWELPIENTTSSPLTDYFSLGEEWQFIHNIRPDIFVIKKGNDVVIGSTDFYSVWLMRRNLS